MVAIVAGTGLGLERSSAWVLGSQGQLGSATLGRGGDNVYVNAASGNLIVQNTDEMLMGLGPDDPVVRTYNSQGALPDDTGVAWRQSVGRKISAPTGTPNAAGSTATLTDWDGSDVVFTWDATRTAYVSNQGDGAFDTLTYVTGTQAWTFTDGATQITETYDGANGGRITARTDPDGKALTFTYTSNLLTKVQTSNTEYTTFTYSGSNLSQVQTYRHLLADGSDAVTQMTRVTYGYDTSNRLQTVTVDLTPGDNSVADGKKYTTTYGYDAASKRVNLITQTDGSSLQIGYVQVGGVYRVASLIQTAAAGQTRLTSFSYDTTNRVTTVTDPMGFVTQLAYDAVGQLTKITAPPASAGAANQVTQFAYNANGDVTSILAPDGTTSTYGYDANGNRTSEVDGAGVQITRTFSAKNLKLTETTYPAGGAGTTTRYVYDPEYHLRFVISPLGEVTEYRYNVAGQRTTALDYVGSTYDVSSLTATQSPSETTLAAWAGALVNPPTTQRTDTAYDFRGDISTVTVYEKVKADGSVDTAAAASTTYYTYDQSGRLLSKKTPTAATAQVFQYDGLGRVVLSSDFAGVATNINFNDTGSQTKLTFVNGLVQTSTYDLAGELISYSESGTGVTTATTTYAYDADGRLRKVTDPNNTTSYRLYDNDGRKTADIAADGTIIEYAYNVDDQLTTTIHYNLKLSPTQLVLVGDLTQNPSVATIRPAASAFDRWDWKIFDADQRLAQTIDGAGAVTDYLYDGASQLISTKAYANPLDAAVLAALKTPVGTSVLTAATPFTPNAPPAVGPTNVFTTIGGPITFDPRANASDVAGDALKIIAVSAATNGAVIINGAGTSVTYTPAAGYTGTDTFSYTLSDGRGGTVGALATVNVYPVNQFAALAPGMVSAWSDGGGTGTFSAALTAGPTLSITKQSLTKAATLSGDGLAWVGATGVSGSSGNFAWDLIDGQSFTLAMQLKAIGATTTVGVSIHYWSADWSTSSDSASVLQAVNTSNAVAFSQTFTAPPGMAHAMIVIAQAGTQTAVGSSYGVAVSSAQLTRLAPVKAPVAVADTLNAVTFTALTFDPRVNDTDFNGDSLAITVAGPAAHGTVTFTGTSVTYKSAAGYTGADNFSYTISDGHGGTQTATVNVTVRAADLAPTATGVSVGTTVGTTLTFDPRAQAADADGDVLSITLAGTAAHGTVNYTATSITYVPTPGYTGADSIAYTLSDGRGGTVSATATVNVYAANQFTGLAPGAVQPWSNGPDNVAFTPTQDASGVLLIQKTLSAAAPATPDGLSWVGASALWGVAGGNAWDVTAGQRFGLAMDMSGLGATSTVAVTIHYWTSGWAALSDSTQTLQIVNGAWSSFAQTYSAPTGAFHATILISQAGAQGAAGSNYGLAIRNAQFVTLTATQPMRGSLSGAAPVAVNDVVKVLTNSQLTFDPRVNDADLDANSLTISGAIDGAHGRVTVSADGTSINYVPDAGYAGTDQFTYTLSDGRGGVSTGTVNLVVGATASASAADRLTRNFYDADGRLSAMLDAQGYLTQTLYDAAGRATQTVRYAKAAAANLWLNGSLSSLVASVGVDAADIHTWSLYDGRGLLRAKIDGEGDLTRYAYFADGSLSQVIVGQKLNPASLLASVPTFDQLPNAVAGEVLQTTSYTRDAFGKPLSQTHSLTSGTTTTTYQYDNLQRLVQTTTAAATADARSSLQGFDLRGRLVKSLSGVGAAALAALGASPTQAQIDQIYTTYGTSYVYDADDRLVQTLAPDGAGASVRTLYYYDDLDRLTYQIDPLGQATQYIYDSFGEVTDTIVYANPIAGATLSGLSGGKVVPALTAAITASSFDRDTRVSYDVRGQADTRTDAANNVTRYVYDAFGDLVRRVDPIASGVTTPVVYVYDRRGQLTSQSRVVGGVELTTGHVYDAYGREVQTLDPAGARLATNYDRAGQTISVVVDAGGLNLATAYTYDGDGHVVAITDPANHTTRAVYDAAGRQIYAIDAAGDVVATVYDPDGRVIQTTRYWNPIAPTTLAGLPLAATAAAVAAALTPLAAKDATTNYVYDASGRLIYQVDALQHVTAYTYDFAGRVLHTTEYTNAVTAAASYTASSFSTLVAVAATDRTTRYVYDAAGQLAFKIDAEGDVTGFTYDASGAVLSQTRFDALYLNAGDPTLVAMRTWQTSNSNSSNDQLQTWTYDADGRVTDAKDGAQSITHRVYDARGLVTDETVAFGSAIPSTTHRVYDAAGRLQSQTTAYGAAAAATTAYTYDADGRILTITDPRNYVTKRAYDAAGRLISSTVDPGGLQLVTSYQYDAAGNQVKLTDPNGRSGYFYYDAANRLVLQIDPAGYATRSDYDPAGQLTKTTRYYLPTSGAAVGAAPSTPTHAKDEITTFGRDKLERLTSVTDAETWTETYSLNGFGNVYQFTNKLGGVTTNLYDRLGQLKSETKAITWTDGAGAAQSQTVTNTYQYDRRGNRTVMVEASGRSEQRTTNYGYDLDDRLNDQWTTVFLSGSTTATVHTLKTQYDARGNVAMTTDAAGVLTYFYYDAANRKIAQLAAVDPAGGGLGSLTAWTYDAKGNLQTQTTYGARTAPTAAGGAAPSAPSGDFRKTVYVYDAADRKVSTAVKNVLFGRMTPSGYIYGANDDHTTDIVTKTSYDKNGNVQTLTDGNGGVTYLYYDANGHKTAQVDAGGYLTVYQPDTEGRVLTETAYAKAATGVSVSGYVTPASTADDRITTYTYDRNGRRTSESRAGVQISTVDATTGAPTPTTGVATNLYSYDKLGDLVSKTDPNNAVTQLRYDSFGRQIRTLEPSFADYRSTPGTPVIVTPTTDISYNGLDQVVQSIDRGDGTTSAPDRTTTNVYGAGGRLVSVTDPTGFTKTFSYDKVGRETVEQYGRLRSDNTTETDGLFVAYDAAGRETSRKTGILTGATWGYGDTQEMFYDAYGEVVARGTNSGGVLANAQEFAEYDGAGRIWRTNFGDGVTKAYAYDDNGNATALLQAIGSVDLRNIADLGTMLIDTAGVVNKTFSVYDSRNELIDTIQSPSNNSGASPVHAVPIDISSTGTQYFQANVTVANSNGYIATNVAAAGVAGDASLVGETAGTVSLAHTAINYPVVTHPSAGVTVTNYYDDYSVDLSSPQITEAYGAGAVTISITLSDVVFGGGTGTNIVTIPPGVSHYAFTVPSNYWVMDVSVSKNLGVIGTKLIADLPLFSMPVNIPPTLIFRNVSAAASMKVFARVAGTGPYMAVTAAKFLNSAGSAIDGWWTVDMSQPPFNGAPANTSFDVKYYAMDGAGKIANAQEGTATNTAGAITTTFNAAAVADPLTGQVGPGQALLTHDGGHDYLMFAGLPSGTAQGRLSYRALGSSDAWSAYVPVSNGAYGQTGLFVATLDGIVGPKEYWFEALDSAGNVIGNLHEYGRFNVGSSTAITPMGQYTSPSKVITLAPPATATYQQVRFLQSNGSWSGWYTRNAGGSWPFDASILAPNFTSSVSTSYEYDTYNGANLLSHTYGTLTLGYNGQGVTVNNTLSAPNKIQFKPPQTNASSIKVYWRTRGSTAAFSVVQVFNSSGVFAVDADATGMRPPPNVTNNLEFYYDALDANGNVLPPLNGDDHVHGYLVVQNDSYALIGGQQIQWVIDQPTGTTFQIHRQQAFNAFGEISSETDGRGYTTDFTYNTLGKLVTKKDPLVAVADETGASVNARPVTNYAYDRAGRLVAQQDANGNWVTQSLLAGSGANGDAALTLVEFHPDGGKKSLGYDIFGDLRTSTDELNAVTTYSYDKADRLTEVDHAPRLSGNSPVNTQLKDYYAYDGLGERIRHTNSVYGTTVVETTDYDAQQRVTKTVTFGGLATTYAYLWLGAAGGQLSTVGLGNYGGWQTSTTTTTGTATEKDDLFGHVVARQDLGAHTYSYSYNSAGELLRQTNSAGQLIDYTYYTNGYVASVTDGALHMRSTFEYDSEGNRTLETYNSTAAAPIYYQNAVVYYDALNRITEFKDAKADITYKYDANSNRREVKSVYNDGLDGSKQTQDYWYKYDGLNRFVLTMGTLSGNQIIAGSTGVEISYNAAGERVSAKYVTDTTHTDRYSYSADGYLENTTIDGVLRARRTNDALGRTTLYEQFTTGGATDLTRNMSYDRDNRVTNEADGEYVNGAASATTIIVNDYKAYVAGAGYTGADQQAITHSSSARTLAGQSTAVTTNTDYDYVFWDEAKQSGIRVGATDPSNKNSGKWATGLSQLSYDVNGHLTQMTDNAQAAIGQPAANPAAVRVLTYENDAYGQVLVREERDGGVLGPRQLYYYFDGHRIGDVGNNGPSPTLEDYAQELAQDRTKVQKGGFRFGKPVASADFDQNYQPINSGYPSQAASAYTVRSGDTLRSIALSTWGDASLWYLIAEANGLTASTALLAGQILTIPNKVTNLHNNSSTFRVYNPGEAIGDTLPTLPPEPAPPAPKHHGCSVGRVILEVVAMAIDAFSGFDPFVMVAVDAAKQGVAMATGLQDKFSWKEFGTTVVAAGVSEGLQSLPAFKAATNTLAGGNQAVARGLQAAASNVLSQGVDMATGLQKRFDWAGVAVSAIGSAAGYQAGKMLNGTGTFGTNLGMGAANAVASAATRSLLTGNSFGNSLVAELPNAIASTIGNTIAGQMAAAAQAKASAERVQSSFDANGDPLYPVNQPMTVADAQVQRATPLSINPDDFIPLPTMSGLSGATNLAASAGSRANAPGGAPRRSARQSTWADGLTWADGDVSRINPFYKAPVQGPTFHLAPPTWSAVSPQKTTLENRFVGFISDEQATTFGDYVRGGSSEFVEGILGGAVGPEGVVLQDLGAALGAAGRLGSSLLGRLTLGGTAAETAAGDGLVYLRTDTTGALKPYIGQTTEANELARQAAHARAFPNSRFEFTTIESGIPKGSALDIAEHNAIQDLTGGVAARRSPAVSNLRDPVGPLRRPGFGLPEPK